MPQCFECAPACFFFERVVFKHVACNHDKFSATLFGDLAEARHRAEPVFAALYERERLMSLHLEPDEEELENLPLTGYAKEAMRELIGVAGDEATARDAVNLLFRLSKEVH